MSDATRSSGETRGGGRLVDFSRRRGLSTPPETNLPLQLTSFVGRTRELAALEELLADETRLLTLTGPGGAGKTRLAAAVAARVAEHFEDGVWWVELAPLSDERLVPQAVASVLGVQESQGRSVTEMLAEDLRELKILLVLDNCEHLVGACAELADTLLHSSPGLRILATSRESLGVAGELSWPVPPLSSPDPEDLPSIEELGDVESVRLFVERARYRLPGFALGHENASSVAQVCTKLDGIPLAIELAAANVKTLSVEQISNRLEHSFGLLSGRDRTAPERQRTLRGALDWSYELLDEKERDVFGRLSVFAGGFTLDAAEAVCAGDGIEPEDVLELLTRLVEKSLVLVAQRSGEARYRLLEPTRQYAAEKLQGSGEVKQIQERHAEYYLALAEEAEPELKGAQQEEWLGRLEAEHDNLRAVLDRALKNGEADLGLRIAGVLGGFWFVRGRLSEGRRWLEAALEGGVGASKPVRTRALLRAGLIAREQGDYERSVELVGEALALARKLGDKTTAASALHNLGWAALLRDELQRAAELTQESLILHRETNDEVGVARALTVLGLLANARGDHERAMALHEEGLGLARQSQEPGGIVVSLMPGALASLGQGDHKRARELCEEGLEASWRLKMVHPTAYYLQIAACVAGSQGQPVRSARLWGAAEASLASVGLDLAPLERRFYEPYIVAARSRLGAVAFEVAWAEGQKMTMDEAVDYALGADEPDLASEDAVTSPLSGRETEVLKLVAQGLTNPQVARRLYLSPRTVGQHLRSIYRKLGVPSRAAAAKYATEHNLI